MLDLIPLVECLASRAGSYRIDVAGDGALLKELRSHFQAIHHENVSITFHGLLGREEVITLFRESHASILLSDYEGMSISMLESMALGCVPVVTEVSGSREAISSGKNGYLVPVGDVGAMANHLEHLALNREFMYGLSASSIQHVSLKHDPLLYDQALVRISTSTWTAPCRRWPLRRRLMPLSKQREPDVAYHFLPSHLRAWKRTRRLLRGAIQPGGL